MEFRVWEVNFEVSILIGWGVYRTENLVLVPAQASD